MVRGRLVLVACALMLSQTAIFIVRPMTSYRIIALGDGSAVVGLVTAAFALAPLVLAVPFGRVAGRHTGRLAVAGAVVMAAGCVGQALMRTVTEAVLASVVLGAGHVAVMIALQMVITAESAEHEYDRNFAWFMMGASAGQLLGPLIGAAVLSAAAGPLPGTTAAMLLAAGAAGAVALLGLPLLSGRPRRGSEVERESGQRLRGVVTAAGAGSAIYVGVVVLASIEILTAYLPVLGEESGIPPVVVGLMLSVRAGASLASRVLIGAVSRRVSRTAVLVGTGCLAALGFAGITLTAEVWLLMALMVVLGFALGFGQPLALSWLVILVPVRSRGDALAVRLIGNRLGQVVAPSAAAVFSGAVGNRSVFWMLSGLLASSAWLVQRFRRAHGEPGR